MLNDLDSLSENINRLLRTVEASRSALSERDHQLAKVRVERDQALTTTQVLRDERDKLRDERDALLSKIEDAQIKLNAILEKLPPPRASTESVADDGSTEMSAEHEHRHGEGQHLEGETYDR